MRNFYIIILLFLIAGISAGCGDAVYGVTLMRRGDEACNVSTAYEKVMAYQTDDYLQQSVADFNNSLHGGDYPAFLKAYSAVVEDIMPDDENYEFVMLTLGASTQEIYYEEVEKRTDFNFGSYADKKRMLVELAVGERKLSGEEPYFDALINVGYRINYTIPDSAVLTVAERDNALRTIQAEMQKYVDGLSEAEIMDGDIRTLLSDKSAELAGSVSTDNIKVSCEIEDIETNLFSVYNDPSFSSGEYRKLCALQFDDYEYLTISDYQNRVWTMTDTVEYRDLLERVSHSDMMFKLMDCDEMAAYFFYILEPLTSENWRTRSFTGCAYSDFPYPSGNVALEYEFTLTILDADTLTVRDYNAMRINVINGMQELCGKTKEELQDETSMSAAIDSLICQLETEKIEISIEYVYYPIEDNIEGQEQEERRYANGTKEDYRSLLTLKTSDYQDMPLSDFNMALLEWANEDYGRMERIGEDTAWNDFLVALNDRELSFVKLTVFLSGMENGKYVQANYTGRTEESPVVDVYLPQKTAAKGGKAAWCSLYYQFSYTISDKESITVGERDSIIGGMVNAVDAFWMETDIEDILKMNERDIAEKIQKFAKEYSTDKIIISTDEEHIQFESMDERY